MAEENRKEKRGIRRPRLYGCVFNIVVLIGAAVVVFLMVTLFGGQLMDGVREFFLGNQTPIVDTSAPTVLQQVRNMALLQTTRYDLEKVIEGSQGQGGVFSSLTSDSLLFIAVGHVTAGVDLNQLSDENFVVDGSSVTVTLPPAQLIDCIPNDRESRVYDRQSGLLANNPDLETRVRQAALVEIRDGAVEAGILDHAAEQAEFVLAALLRSVGFDQVEVSSPPARAESGAPIVQTSDTCFNITEE